MNQYTNYMVGISLIAVTGVALAEEKVWKSQAELGILNTSGNSQTSSVNAKINGTREEGNWRHNLQAEALRSSTGSLVTAEKYLASGQSDYKFTETDYAFGRLNYEFDKFSGYEYQAGIAAGYGKRVLHQTDMTLDLEIGPGLRVYKVDPPFPNPPLDSETDPFLRLAAKYLWKVSSSTTFTQDLSSEIGSELTQIKSVTGLQANINSTLAMKITFTANNKSDVPLGTKKTDTETAVTLVYSF